MSNKKKKDLSAETENTQINGNETAENVAGENLSEDEKNAEAAKKLLIELTKETETLKEENKKLLEKQGSLEKELAEQKDMYLRVLAEYDNFRKRTASEKSQIYADTTAETVEKILPILDNLERAASCKTENDADSAVLKGVEMVLKTFVETFEKMNVTEIPALGETFDPNLHNAVMKEENPEKGENEITEVFQKGYKLGNKVIRYSMVKVAN